MSDRSRMNSLMEHDWSRPIRPWKATAILAATAILMIGCGGDEGDKKGERDRVAQAAPTVSVVVAPVVQKTVPLMTELTARTDAAESVEIRARVKAFLATQSYTE